MMKGVKRGRDSDETEVRPAEGDATQREHRLSVVAKCGDATSVLNVPASVLECILYPTSQRHEACPGLFFFFTVSVLQVEHTQVVVRLTPREGAAHDITARGNVPCPTHGPFWCSCEPMRFAAQQLLSLLNVVLGFPADFSIALVVDEPRPAVPHILVHSSARQWFVQLVGTALPPCQIGPFRLAPVDQIATLLRQWDPSSLQRQRRPDCCAHCGGRTHGCCSLCRYFLCRDCQQNCEGCGRPTCRACCNYVEPQGHLCFACLPRA